MQTDQTIAAERDLTKDRSFREFVAPALIGLFVLAIWGQLVAKLSTDWSINPQYEFGYFVPMLIVYLLARRWPDRPVPSLRVSPGLLWGLAIGLLALLLPLRIVDEGNPDWRPLSWLCALVVIATTLLPITAVGGLSWARHFAFPLALILVAIPWPLPVEEVVIQSLTRGVTALTTELLNLANIPAVQHGNSIEVPTGFVDVAEACSGIRSLQGTLMAALFFGELYRCFWVKRILLLFAGVFVALALNLCRTFLLGWIAATQGMEALEHWHNRAGYGIFVVSFACLWIMAGLLRDPQRKDPEDNSKRGKLPSMRVPILALVAVGAWLITVEVATSYWYSLRERNLGGAISWNIQWPPESSAFRFTPMQEKVQSILRYSQGTSGVLEQPGDPVWQIFFLQWDPGRASAQLVSMHRPEICMPAHGMEFLSQAGSTEVKVDNLRLPFNCSTFKAGSETTYVFRCLWEDRPMSGKGRERTFDLSANGRLASAWYGRRNLGEKLLQIAMVGARDFQEAESDLQKKLPQMIRINR